MAEWMVAADMEINIPGDSTAVGSEIDAAPCRSDSSVRPGYRDPRRPHRMVAIRHTQANAKYPTNPAAVNSHIRRLKAISAHSTGA
jgi:hypothetical protein